MCREIRGRAAQFLEWTVIRDHGVGNLENNYWIGVDLGGTKILAGVFDEEYKRLGRAKIATDSEKGPDAVIGRIHEAVDAAIRKANVSPGEIRGLGMCIPGQVDRRTECVRYAPNLDWRNLELARVPNPSWTWPCHFENDVKLGTFGEFTHGAAKGAQHVLGIFVGTGVGGGLILNGELYSGFNFNAGEIGHTIVHWRKGTELETIAGRRSMMSFAKKLLDDAPKKVRKEWKDIDPAKVKSSELGAMYEKGDMIALQLVEDAAHALGAAVASGLNLLSPEVVVIGGGVAGALGPTFLERIWEIAQRLALPNVADGVRCVPAALEDDSGIVGAAAYARCMVQKGGGTCHAL
jgi:glucokinase